MTERRQNQQAEELLAGIQETAADQSVILAPAGETALASELLVLVPVLVTVLANARVHENLPALVVVHVLRLGASDHRPRKNLPALDVGDHDDELHALLVFLPS